MASVDVIIPNYNYAHFLPECVDSVLSQGVDDVRIIIIDNASQDNSIEVACQLARMDSRIEIVRHGENLGYHASFNEGIALARADYFMILCADDVLMPNAMRNAIALLEKFSEATFVLGTNSGSPERSEPSAAAGHLTGGTDFIEQFCRMIHKHVPAHAILVRTSAQKAIGPYRSSLPLMSDLEVVLRLACVGAVAEMSGPLAIQRMHSTNISSVTWDDRLCDLRATEAVFSSFFAQEGRAIANAPRLHKIARNQLAQTAFWSALSHIYRRRISEAVGLYRYSFRLDSASALLFSIGHLFRTRGAFKHMADVISGRFR